MKLFVVAVNLFQNWHNYELERFDFRNYLKLVQMCMDMMELHVGNRFHFLNFHMLLG